MTPREIDTGTLDTGALDSRLPEAERTERSQHTDRTERAEQPEASVDLAYALDDALDAGRLPVAADLLTRYAPHEITAALERLSGERRAIGFRLLDKQSALTVFERFEPALQSELVETLGDEAIAAVFAELDPDDRVGLLEELPATVAKRLVLRLTPAQRGQTAVVLGYPQGSVGRRTSPEYVTVRPDEPADAALRRVRRQGRDRTRNSETIYTIPVVDNARVLVGVVSLRDLFLAGDSTPVSELMRAPTFAYADDDAEEVARRCVEQELLAMAITDREQRLVGLLTIDDAVRVVDAASTEDAARAGAAEPLRRPYLSTPIRTVLRSRIVWLLVLGLSALFTVNVLELFQASLEKQVALALFIPLLTGIGGNTGSQAATTITRALATGDARPRDLGRVAFKECRTGFMIGILLGSLACLIASLIYGMPIGLVVGLTLVGICTIAASAGGTLPLVAKAVGIDPAVFSTPFISTFCDATGLLIYFTIASFVLGV